MYVKPKPMKRYPWLLRPFFWNQKRKYGAVLEPALVWGRVPKLFMAVAALFGVLERRRSPVPPALRSLVTVRVSQINHCRFCVDVNSATLNKRGVSWDKIDALEEWASNDQFDDRERAVLAYTEAVTRTDGQVDAAMIEDLKRHFDDDALVELTGLIAFQNLSSKFNNALDMPPQGFCKIRPGGEQTEE